MTVTNLGFLHPGAMGVSLATTALLTAIMAAADRLGVRQQLENQWSRHGSYFTWSTIDRIRKATPKGWRFSGEMDEIASTFGAVGLPEGFHLAAADIYQRLDSFKDAGNKPSLEDIIDTIFAANPVRFEVDKRDNG